MRVIATAGHVDHGKSALVLALTGTDPDRFAEEKRRGLTIDLGFAHTTLPSGAEISIIDVPGHVRFLRNMLAGIGGIDACLFVVAATEGWKPQSEEHLRILELLGVRHGVIALTMVDLVDDEWREIAELELADRLTGTFLERAPVVAVAAPIGRGIDELGSALDRLVATTPAAADCGRPRLWVDRVFAAKGSGTVVTGTLTGGALGVDEHVSVGSTHAARIRSIQTHGEARTRVAPGHRVALNLSGIEHGDIDRGDAIVRSEQWLPTQRFDATLAVLDRLDHDVSRRGAYTAYIGSGELSVSVRVLGDEAIAAGTEGLVRIHLPRAVPLVPGDRFILRESGRSETVGGGEVLDVHPVLPASKARPDRDPDRIVRERGWVTVADYARLTGHERAPVLGSWVVMPERLASTEADLRERLATAGDLGLDLAVLDDRERAVLATLADVSVDRGVARLAAAPDPLADHPFLAALLAGSFAPPDAAVVARSELRQLVRRGLVVERGGICFHPDTVDAAAVIAAELLARDPAGFTVAQFRDATGSSRKHAVPLVTELDARGVTRRRDDLRIAGPRLPEIRG